MHKIEMFIKLLLVERNILSDVMIMSMYSPKLTTSYMDTAQQKYFLFHILFNRDNVV